MSAGTRKFAKGLNRPGTAKNRRESASHAARESFYSTGSELIKSSLADPIDYEVQVLRKQSEIVSDPQRNLLEFPVDCFEATQQPQDRRTVIDSVPEGADKEVSSLMVKECITTYQNNWHLIINKYEDFAGDYLKLPKQPDTQPKLRDVVYEIDEEADHEEESSQNNLSMERVTKCGWLYKAPSYTGPSISIRQFKRRFFDLKQMPDNTYILNYYKDEKTSRDPKGAIYLDSCIGAHMVSLTTKTRKYAFEIRMQDQSCHLLAAESDNEAQDWISTINQALQSTISAQFQNEEPKNAHQESESMKSSSTMESLQSSMHPELVKYSKETDQKNADARKEGRVNLIQIYPDFQERFVKMPSHQSSLPPPPIKQVKHQVMVQCKTISFNLRGVVIDGADEPKTAVEPFFVSFCLYDVSQMKKISADIHVDLNHDLVRKMIPDRDLSSRKSPSNSLKSESFDSKTGEPSLATMVKDKFIAYPKNCVFNVSNPHPDIYLVARIEKVLQGSIKACAQPYMKSDGDTTKTAMKVLKHAKLACQRLGQYRMPFAWIAKPLFADNDGTIDRTPFGDYVYKQESSKLSEEHLLKYLADFRKPDKLTKLEDIPCVLDADFLCVPSDVTSLLSPSLAPIKPFSEKVEPIFEVDEFFSTNVQDQNMHMEYVNNYFIYPRSLKYDSQKSFAKARNIAVVVEFKDSDAEGAAPLCSFYNRPGKEIFTKRLSAAVLHHDDTPEFYEEFKLALPAQLHSGHHLLFSFFHIIVDASGKKKDIIKNEIGHAWLPLLTKDGQVWCEERTLPVCANLPPGYLSQPDVSSTYPRAQHNSPEMKWVDGGRNLFRLSTRLVSSVYTTDPHLHNFFGCCQKSVTGTASDQDLVKYLKTLLAAEDRALIQFLPTLLNQLFRLLASRKSSKDVKSNCIKSLVHIFTVCHKSANHKNLLKQYIKYMFVTEPWLDYTSFTVHEELVTSMTELLRPTVTDFLTMNKILKHMSFFLEVVAKSMAQHLIMAKKTKQKRNERFPVSFQHAIQSLLTTTVPHVTGKWKTNYEEVCNANSSIAHFIKHCFTYVDRGFIFKLVNYYMENFNPGDPKVLFEFKFEFLRVICNHEHYIPLNLPFAVRAKRSRAEYAYSLSEEYCRNHFLAGHLLQSLNAAMYEPTEIRSIAIDTFKNLIAKHAFDARYNTDGHQSRIAALYLPFLRIVLDNAGRFSLEYDGSYTSRDDLDNTPSKGDITISYSPQIDKFGGGSLRMTKPPDINMLSAISSPGLFTKGSRGSLAPSELQATAAIDKVVEKNHSLTSATRFTGSERYDISESRSLLICFLQLVKVIPPDALKSFWMQSTTEEQIQFFDIIEVCMHLFRYTGRRQQLQNMRFGSVSKKSSKSMTLPVRIRPGTSHQYKHISILAEPMVTQTPAFVTEQDAAQNSLLEANLSSEVGMIVLDVLGDFTRHFKKYLQKEDGDNPLMQRVSSTFLLFLQISQSESVLKHAFASLRHFMCKFRSALFRGKADLCASLIYYTLKCCNSPLSSTRLEACALLYLLMRENFEFSSGKNFVRSHLQMIKAVSQLISEEVGIGNSRFQNSLSVINTYAQSDKGMQHSVFHIEVKDLTKRIRTVLMATAAMKEHKDDPEMLVDLQYSLAKSYAATPELRKTWLESMARVHEKHKNYSEAAMCYIHVAALVAEYLKRKVAHLGGTGCENSASGGGGGGGGLISRLLSVGTQQVVNGDESEQDNQFDDNALFLKEGESMISKGCSAFRSISPNVEKEESAIKEDHGMQDVQYNEVVLTELLRRCVAALETAERYELMASVYRMIIPFYEKNRDYVGLAEIYGILKDANLKIVNVNHSGKRLLGTYFRVAFYGQQYFGKEGEGEYIYKEPKLTQLSEISMRLQNMYGAKFGPENVKLIQESNKVNSADLDPKYAYVQVTYVKPYFDEQELGQRVTYFERAHNVKNFVFETPFTPSGKARGGIEEQWKRKTILITEHSFPYVKKRILVVRQKSYELKPIEVALDEMESKCSELDELVSARTIDLKKLQLRLQGSVGVTVNAGPLAYAKAFLEDSKMSSFPQDSVDRLRKVFRRFVALCGQALEINEQLIMSDQREYHENLKKCYHIMGDELSHIMHEPLIGDDEDAISLTASSMGEVDAVFSNNVAPQSAPGSLAKRTSAVSIRPMSAVSVGPKKTLQGVVSDASNV